LIVYNYFSVKLVDASFVFLLMFLLVCYDKRRNEILPCFRHKIRRVAQWNSVEFPASTTQNYEGGRERERETDACRYRML